MIVILQINAPMRTVQGFKEAIAMDLEKYGVVKVLEVRQEETAEPEQLRIGGVKR